jgi:hypothetical protein
MVKAPIPTRAIGENTAVDEYASTSAAQQRMYRLKCNIADAPLAGLIYVSFNPRFTWLKAVSAW